LFDAQLLEYRESVLPQAISLRVSIEAGSTLAWARYVGREGVAIGIDTFGAFAPIQDLYAHFGITVQAVVAAATRLCNGA